MASKYSLTLQLQLQSPQNVAQVVNQLQKQLGAVAVNVKVQNAAKATQQINQLTSATNNASSAAAKMGDAFGVSLKRFAAFSLASRAIGVFTRGLAGAIDSAIEFQDGLVKISQITGQSLENLNALTKEVTRLSTTLGVASNEILGVTNILAQAGLKANDLTIAINALTKTKLAPTFGDINETAEGAVALIAQFGEGVGALERQLGSINRVAAEFAVESEDLIEVVRRTGGVFKASGGDLNELLGLFTSVRATTRESAESIATALKTIFTRIQRPETIQYLRQFGVELTDLNGKFVGPFEATKRLSSALAGLGEGDIKFISIAEELGGYRQIGKVIPLLRQFETAELARQTAIEGGASLDKDAATAQQSLAVQFTKTREKFLALIRGLSETSSFQILVKTSLNLANALISVADALKPIIPLVATLAAVKFAGNIGSFFGAVGGAFTRKQFGGKIHKFASGGVVPGSGNRDTVPAMLTPGEFVIRKSSVKKLGAGRLAAMNENRYASGGIVTKTIQELNNGQRSKNKINLYKSPYSSYPDIQPTDTVKGKVSTKEIAISQADFPDMYNNMLREQKNKENLIAEIKKRKNNIESFKSQEKVLYGRRSFFSQWAKGNAFEKIIAKKLKFKYGFANNLDELVKDHYAPLDFKRGDAKFSSDPSFYKSDAGQIEILSKRFRDTPIKNLRDIPSPEPDQYKLKSTQVYIPPENMKAEFDAYVARENEKREFSPTGQGRKNLIAAAQKAFFGGAIQKFNLGSKVSQTTRRVGYIDSDVLADPANAGIVTPEMEKLGITSIPDYMMYLAKMAATARKTGELGRFRVVAAMAGAGKSTLMLGGQNNPKIKDDATLRNTTRFPILRPTDISRASEVITATATVTQEKLDNFIKAADKTYGLSSSTKEERQEIKRRRGVRNTSSNMATAPAGAANTLFGREPGTTDSAPTDSGPMEAMLAANLTKKQLRVLGIRENKRARIKRENEQVETLKKEIGLFYGSFSPTTVGHQSMMDAAIASGISPQDFLVLVGSNEALNTKDPHSFRTAVFDQDFRALMAQASFGARGAMISKKGNRDFGIPSAMEISAGASGRRRFVVPAVGSTAFVAGKDDKASKKYTDAGYKVQDVARDEGNVSGSIARDAILGGNMAEMQRLLSPEVFDVVQKNLGQLRNRAEVLPKIIENVRRKEVASLGEIEAKLANLPARIDKKKVAADPEYAKLAEQVVELRKRRDKIKSSGAIKPFKLIDKLAKRYPEKYGLKRFATGGMVPGTGNRDTVPAMLTPGEFVIRKSSVAKIGPENLAAMNSGGAVQRFADGTDGRGVKQQIIAIKDEEAARSNKPLPSKEALRSASTTRNKVKVSEVLRDDEEFYSKGEAKNQTNLEKLQAYKKNSGAKKYGGAFLYSPSSRPPSNLVGTINPQILAEEATKGLLTNKNSINNFKSTYPLSEPIRIEAGILNEDIRENFENGLYDGIVSTIQNSAKQLEAQTSIDLFTAQGNRRAAEILATSNIEQTIGNIYEASLKNAGGYFDEKKRNANFDFPGGLGGGVGKNFTNRYLENLPTDAKATYSSDLVRNLLEKIENNKRQQISERLSDAIKSGQRFATGGVVQKLWFGGEATNNIKYSFARVLEAKKKLSDKQLQKIRKSMLVGSDVSIGAFKDPNRVTSSGTLAKFTGGFYDPINKSVELNPENMSRYMARHELGHAKAYELAELQARELYSDNPKMLEQKLADLKRNPVDASEISGVTGRNITGMQTAQNAIAQLLQQSYKNHVAYDNNIDYRTRPQELFADALAKVPSEVRKILTSSTKTDVVYNALLDYWDKNPGPIRGLADISPDEIGWRYGRAPQNRKPVIGKKIKSIAEPKVKMASGGAAPSDTVPALLTPGEFVFSKKSAQRIGYGNLNRMNKHGVAGYAKGGAVAVQRFNDGNTGSGVRNTGGGDGFNILNDKASQLAFGFSLLSGTLSGTETAFGKVIATVTSWGATLSSAIAIMNAFGVSLSLQKINISKIFGSGKGGLGDVIGGYQRDGRKSGESFRGRFNFASNKKTRIQSQEYKDLNDQIKQVKATGGDPSDLIAKRTLLRNQGMSQSPQSLTGKAGQFLAQRQAAGGFTGRIAGIAGRGIGLAAGAGGGGALAAVGALLGPVAALGGGFALLNSVVGNLIGAETKYQQAVEKGNSVQAQYWAIQKETNAFLSLFGQGVSEWWINVTSLFTGKTVDSVKAQADAAAKAARYTNELAENEKKASETLQKAEAGTISFTEALKDKSVLANLRNAQSAQAATEKSIVEGNKFGRAGLLRNSFTLGGLFGQTAGEYNAELDKKNMDALNESIKRSREEFDKLAPAIAKSNKVNFALGKTNEQILKESEDAGIVKKLTPLEEGERNRIQEKVNRQKTIESVADTPGYKFALNNLERQAFIGTGKLPELGKDATKLQKEEFEARKQLFETVRGTISSVEVGKVIGPGGAPSIRKKSEEEINRETITKVSQLKEGNNLANLINELKAKGTDATPEEQQRLKVLDEQFKKYKELETAIENQRKAYEENQKFLKSLNYGLSLVSAKANAASIALQNYVDQSETGSIRTEASIKTLEASLSKAGSAINQETFKSAQGDVRNVLKQFGADDKQLTGFDARTEGLFKARQSLAKSLEGIKKDIESPEKAASIDTSPEAIKKRLSDELLKNLDGTDEELKKALATSFSNVQIDNEDLLGQIKAGNLENIVEQALNPLEQAFIDQIKPIVDEYNQQQKILVDLTKQRIELEKSLAESTKRSLDIELESRKAIQEFGGPVVKASEKLDILNKKIGQDLGLAGVRGITSGSATEVSRTQADIQSRFRVLQSQQDAALKSGQGTAFTGAAGVDQDQRTKLRDAQESLIQYTRDRLDLVREEIELAKKKNELEKSAIDKLVSGDVEGFLKDQQASAAANVLRFGDQDLAKLFTPSALGAGLQSLQGQGLSDKEVETAYRTALMPIGGTERMAQVGAGTTPELEALKREGRDLASVLNETGQGIVEMDTMTVNAKTIQIIGAQDQLNQFRSNIPSQIATIQQSAATNATTNNNRPSAAAAAINAGAAIAGGPIGAIATNAAATTGGDTTIITNLTSSLNRFYESANMLKDLKLTMKLDTTNVNVNFNGAGFLEKLTDEVKAVVFTDVINTIKREFKLDSNGSASFPNLSMPSKK